MDELIDSLAKISKTMYRGLSFLNTDDYRIPLLDTVGAGIGKDSPESIDAAFENIFKQADGNVISAGSDTLKELIAKHRDVFRINLRPDPPAKVDPLMVTPAENVRPFRCPQRRREFLTQTFKELEAVGTVYPNPESKWASPALAVPKPGSNKLRFTVNS